MPVKRVTTVDPETGEVRQWVARGRRGAVEHLEAYDPDAAALERWMLQGYARRLLWDIEERDARWRVDYTEVAPYTALHDRRVRYEPVRERFRLEVEPVPVFTRLDDKAEISAKRKKAARFRVINCCRDRIGAAVQPEVWKSRETGRASYHQVAVCGSVWTCPVCSRRIGLQRQRHVRMAYEAFIGGAESGGEGDRRGDAVMVTFTLRHGAGDDLAALFERLKGADGLQQKTYAYKRLVGYKRTVAKVKVKVASELGYVGRVSATEVTYGRNGWHPHLHQLWFFERRLAPGEIERLRSELFAVWRDACLKVGLAAPLEFSRSGRALGVDVRRALSADEYLTKFGHERQWGVEREMASAHVKRARRGGRTPFQLLADYARGDQAAGGLFRVFAEASLGKHQLDFSKGLRARLRELGLDELLASDEELAGKLEDRADRLGELGDDEWAALLGADRWGIEAHGTLLHIAAKAGFDAAVDWLRGLPSYPGVTRAADRERAESLAWTARAVAEVRRIRGAAFGRRGSAALDVALDAALARGDGLQRLSSVREAEARFLAGAGLDP